ncbi:UDP-N-acetylglucosamine O-acyltransferase [Acidovorax sp. Leaf76]|uniref:acyl-ACP--UDP-N-acetylglucosamine O-acyltransferase n=1 Tax=unclassified Acidovorax TaxID=2684926 RepID=UPI0006FE9981|nr:MULTISPECIES: acyl-ACP--UDP-N-acetylglucosamine O-acyltransferase [unclassified Acidovorax]KQO24385.1 UDP-N-acetylglucosamine O-acyltransferase [Acidovorax sp. Leaf76]KQO39412.1 UDP-N-acetylglucosamine O-acyltransferase [Acidovorax sp. Leaf84]KQS24577.1 UDP-N-acetylglucosamine O-acyltransferase [Acidovorax sp. Leaf191]
MSNIHPTAIIADGARIDPSVTVGPYAVIGPQVVIGPGCTVGAHCVIEGRTTIGKDNRIFQFASLGADPQDKKYKGEDTELVIGDRNTVREFCTFNRGVPGAGGKTSIGDDNWIMAYTHIAHDCHVGNHTTMANNTTLAGHVLIGDWVTVGGLTGIHQFVKIGAHAMIGFSSAVSQDVPPFMTVDGNPLSVRGLNAEGLRRRGFSAERVAVIKQIHRLMYRQGLTLEAARAAIADLPVAHPEATADVALVMAFLASSSRGIAR